MIKSNTPTKTTGILIAVLVAVSVLITSQLYAQDAAPTGTALPTAVSSADMTSMLQYRAPDLGYTFEYPLATYSVRAGCTCALANSGQNVLFPGLIEIVPNDLVLYGAQPQQAYRVAIAAVDVDDDIELTPALFGTGAIVQYGEVELETIEVVEVDLNGIAALRVNDVFGDVRPLTAHVIALHEGLLYEIVVESIAGTADAAIPSSVYEDILNSFTFAN